jgi:hypothetical protein
LTTQVLDCPTKPDSPDYRAINAKAIKHWSVLYHMIADWYGRPLAVVQRLGNPSLVIDPERPRRDGPRLLELKGPSQWDGGSWCCLGNGAQGKDVVDLIAYLGECDRRTAGEWLSGLVGRLVEVAAQ